MNEPKLPTTIASESPESAAEWRQYWDDWTIYKKHINNLNNTAYRRKYYFNKNKAKRLNKMYELIKYYPNEAIAYTKTLDKQ